MTGPTDHMLHDILIEIDERLPAATTMADRADADRGANPEGPDPDGEMFRVATRGIEFTFEVGG